MTNSESETEHSDIIPHSAFRIPHSECGIDLVEIDRIAEMVARFGDRFVQRVWTEQEIAICRGRFPELAARFAGKEAAMKTLGTGVVGIGWREVEITREPSGKPVLVLHGKALARAQKLGFHSWSVSLTHTRAMACAVVVALRIDD